MTNSEEKDFTLRDSPSSREVLDILIGIRQRSGISQSQIAMRMCQAQGTISQLETKRFRTPQWKTVMAYAHAIGARVEVTVKLVDPRPDVRLHLGQVWPPENGVVPLATSHRHPEPVEPVEPVAEPDPEPDPEPVRSVVDDPDFMDRMRDLNRMMDEVRATEQAQRAEQPPEPSPH